jgi:TolB-like protein
MAEFLQHLRDRKLVQWALAYLAGAWVVLQVLDMAAGSYGWPALVMRIAFGLVTLGFVVALLLAWYHGERGEQKVSATELVLLSLVMAVGGAMIWRANAHLVVARDESAAAAPSAAAHKAPEKSIAVLPFENLSEERANAYFADGIQDQILTGLARIGDLKVISRTSTLRYASKPENLTEIARQLGVANILEGSVQRAGNRVRINVQLIGAESDNHLWAETYDRTLDDIFAVESEVAEKISEALAAKLTNAERSALARKPTENPAAYEAYLRARALTPMMTSLRADFDRALAACRDAVALDPHFALAWAELAIVATHVGWTGLDASGVLRKEAQDALARARQLDPDLPQVRLAHAVLLYYNGRDFPAALAELDAVRKQLPGDVDAMLYSAFVERRLGQWDRSIAHLEQARSLAPNDARIAYNTGTTLAQMERCADAIRAYDASLQIKQSFGTLAMKLQCLWSLGEMTEAAKILAGAGDSPVMAALRGYQALYQRDPATAAKQFREAVESGDEVQLDINANGYIPARVEWKLLLALSEQLNGSAEDARRLHGEVRDEAAAALAAKQDNVNVEVAWRAMSGLALAGLGERDRAEAESQRIMTLIPASVDAIDGPVWADYAARIDARAGDASRAVPLLETQFRTTGTVLSPALLRMDPGWDAIRGDPDFQALLKNSGKAD